MAVSDLVLVPSEEAKICLFCPAKKCKPECKRVKVALEDLRRKKRRQANGKQI